jgi:hypothetical protein
MAPGGTGDLDNTRHCLEEFVVGNEDLERLEDLLSEFNLFEALDVVRQEVRHSAFLAFLLNPLANHGLGDVFLKRFLQKALLAFPDPSGNITPIDVDVWDLSETEVHREWHNLDLFLVHEEHRLAIIVENKVDSSEHSNQLHRYWSDVEHHYPNYSILAFYLTPDQDKASHEKYLPIDYTFVVETLESVLKTKESTLGDEVKSFIRHYSNMVRRHLVSDSEIADLCRRIYRKHQKALDLIYEYRPDEQQLLVETLQSCVEADSVVGLDHCSKSYVRVYVKEWDIPALVRGTGWTRSKRILLFEFDMSNKDLRVRLIIGPGDDIVRKAIFEYSGQHQPPFKLSSKTLYDKWQTIYVKPFFNREKLEDLSSDQIESEMKKTWARFVEKEMSEIIEAVRPMLGKLV